MPNRSEVSRDAGFVVDPHFRGHGIGEYLHEKPHIHSTGKNSKISNFSQKSNIGFSAILGDLRTLKLPRWIRIVPEALLLALIRPL